MDQISIHAPTRGATNTPYKDKRSIQIFQSTLPRGERRDPVMEERRWIKFQSTLPRGERLHFRPPPFLFHVFQSTLPRGERLPRECYFQVRNVFQSTLPRGERLFSFSASPVNALFQSTLPRGERHLTTERQYKGGEISIHAPTRGATSSTGFNSTRFLNFNPRSHEGSDDIPLIARVSTIYFNPRSHEGSDKINKNWFVWNLHFNPRSHEGSDADVSVHGIPRSISIHAPTRGATRFVTFHDLTAIFQSTLPRGERPRLRKKSSRIR